MNPKCRVLDRRRRGFTLLEVMIALVLLGLLLAVLFAGLRLGARSWDAGESRAREAAERAQVLAFLDRSLARAEPLYWQLSGATQKLAFEGLPDRVSWVAPLPAHRGGGGLTWLSLELGELDGQSALVLGYQFFHPDTLDPEHLTEREILLEGVTGLGIEYFGSGEPGASPLWSGTWSSQNELPQLIRVRVEDVRGAWPDLLSVPRQDPGAIQWTTVIR